ncbi:hypothetical protein M413DRAFT_62718 [Hebeloma cylindrosporum]|uniref:Acyl-CoA thioesterase-like C-terminal domain-containing protein n=1 Tax=Hebeloma cylindrosporum TaxID=76867 RepID=A0A0C3CW58_HEBCY|nr:hypothetical protein M413DRAFT_62718 [Hebeloma cylindrosporum h7]
MDCPRGGSGRGIVHGRMFTRSGTLVAVTTQEGVVRADIRGPAPPITPAKLCLDHCLTSAPPFEFIRLPGLAETSRIYPSF